MERFRVITPAFASSSAGKDPRLTPLPVIRPSRNLNNVDSSEESSFVPPAKSDESGADESRVEEVPSPHPSSALLHPSHMLEIFRTKQMPLSSPAYFKRHLRDDDEGKVPPPSRLQVMEWSEWKQKGLTEESAILGDASSSSDQHPSPSVESHLSGELATVASSSPRKGLRHRRIASIASPAQAHPSAVGFPQSNNRTEASVEKLNTPEYKQKRLRDILTSPIEPNEQNSIHLRSLARRVNTSFMVSLGSEIDALRKEEMQMRGEMHTFIQAERDQLPLKFLFQLPGGAAYCRHRMRRAIALWVLEFEDNQRRMALMQWKAFVEHCRFQIRGKEYQRLAAMKRLRVAIDYVLRGYLTQALAKWIETTQVLIWVDRDHAVRKIQVQVRRHFGKQRFLWLHDSAPIGSRVLRDIYLAPCRNLQFQVPPRVREERRQIWAAAELVQSAYRRRRFRVYLARYRAASSKIQAQQRMRAARAQYRAIRRRIILFQAYIRMLKHFNAYQKLKAAVVLLQTTFRCVRIRRLRRLVICAQRQRQENVLSRVLLVQRLIRGFLGRRVARTLRQSNAEAFNAALVVQRCWYRRNDEWSTFLLLGCLRVKEEEETAFEANVLAYKRNYMARQIRHAWRTYLARKKNAAALSIQQNYRRHKAECLVRTMRQRKTAHRRIKWFFRVHHAKRVRVAAFLQFWWLKAIPGRLARHLRHKRLASALDDARALFSREASAAARMQALVRGHSDRVVAKRERSARKIQRAIREFLLWRRIKHELARIKTNCAQQAAAEYIAAGFQNVYSSKMQMYNFAAMEIQRFYRGTRWRSMLTQSIVSDELRARMATRIQGLWRFNAHRRTAKKLLLAQKRRLTNPFREYGSLSAILKEMIRQSSVYFDPSDDLKGMMVPTWLRRLGLDSRYLDCFQKSRLLANNSDPLDALASLREMDPDTCRKQLEAIGVDDEDELDMMLTNLFAKKTIEETKQLRDELAFARKQQSELKRKCDLALMSLQKVEKRKKDAETALEAILDEMKDFRNPPSALRKQREKCGKELEESMKALSDAQAKCDTYKRRCAEKSEELIARHRELSEDQEPREISALYSQQSLRLISDMNSIRELYLGKFPGLEARALAFVGALDEDQVTMWQLEQFFQAHTSVSSVKANMKMLTFFRLETEMKKADHTRFTQCCDILQYGYERMCDLIDIPMEVVVLADRRAESCGTDPSTSKWGLVSQALFETLCAVRKTSKVSDKAKVWRQGGDSLMQMNAVALGVQSMWRRRAAKKLMLLVRNERGRERIQGEYIAAYHTDHVTPIWEAERKKEQEELDEWLEREAMESRLGSLYGALRYPYEEEWDEATQTYCYYCEDMDGSTRQYAVDGKPVYTIAEEDAAILIQAAIRSFLARLRVLALQREQRRHVRRRALEAAWNRTREERSQTVTLTFRLKVEPNGRIASWLKHRRKVAVRKSPNGGKKQPNSVGRVNKTELPKAGRKREAVKQTADDESIADNDSDEWKSHMNAFIDDQVTLTYNKSVRVENRRDWTFPSHSRPPNAHGQAITGLLSDFVQFTKRVSPDTRADVALRFTKVALRFGWKEIRAAGSTRAYYYNANTGETIWDRPEYTFEDEYAAIKMQTMVRMLVAKNVYFSELNAISFVDLVHTTVQRAGKIGWVGFGLEGVSAAVFLSRFGLSKYTKELSKASVDDIMSLSEAKTKKLGWSKEEAGLLQLAPERVTRKFPLSSTGISLSSNVKHPFNFLSTERLVSQIVSQSLPNQQGRALGLVKAIRGSTTPISLRQLETHLRKFAGRPDEALGNIGEIASLAYATQEPQEREIYQLFLRCVERCIVFAANLKLNKLRRHLSTVLDVSTRLLLPPPSSSESAPATFALLPTTPVSDLSDQEVERYMQAAVDRYPHKIVKGLWESDPSKQQATPQPHFSIAQLAYYLREEALERVLVWVRSALVCQSAFRMHKTRQWYVATQDFRAHSATQIQCGWRVHCALEAKALLESQQRSDYEQCYDKSTKSFFFVYTPTKEKLLDEPRDQSGTIIPFRPMIQDRITKRWVRCWPHYEKKRKKTAIRDAWTDDAANGPPCSICSAERAARRCNECYSPTGDYVDFCLVCFYDRHAPENPETGWHSYQMLHRMKAQFFHCVECRRFSCLRCLQCDENYCERCFQRLHGRGHKRTSHKCEFYDPMAQICVECEVRVAFQLCLVCQDALCDGCMARTHSKGKKAAHDLKLIKQSIAEDQVYCEQCRARCGDARCEYCSRSLCNVCLSDKHALICPETELNQKRQKLLGDKICVECGKAADRMCETCGDRYCSVRWMGNPGCFERFHQKGKRADHAFAMFEAPAMTPEILELEEKVKRKRKKDAEDAEAEAKKMAAAMLALAQEEERARSQKRKKPRKRMLKRSDSSKRRLMATFMGSLCSVERCESPALGEGITFCAKHFTLQHALEVTKQDHLEAAKLLAQIESEGGKLPSSASTFLGSKLLGSLLRPTSAAKDDMPKTKKKKKRTKSEKPEIEAEGVPATTTASSFAERSEKQGGK